MKNTGYKEMLRDRCPKLVNYALKWCKLKESWLNHVYKNFIWIYVDNTERLNATKVVLGIKGKHMNFKFEDTIAWDNLSDEERNTWNVAKSWVSWFQKRYSYIENDYLISKHKGNDIREIKYDMMTKYLDFMCPTAEDDAEERKRKNQQINEFADFLIDCFENHI